MSDMMYLKRNIKRNLFIFLFLTFSVLLFMGIGKGAWGEVDKVSVINPDKNVSYSSVLNWKEGRLVIDVSYKMPVKRYPFPRAKSISLNAVETAISGIFLNVVMFMRIDSYYTMNELVRRDREVLNGLIRHSLGGVIDSSYVSDGMSTFNARYIFPLYGDGGIIDVFYLPSSSYPVRKYLGFEPTRDFTGYVVYAKGKLPSHGKEREYRVNPAMFIRIFDEDMNVVLEKDMCNPEYIRKWGMVAYTDSTKEDSYRDRIGDFPLRIKARKIYGKNSTDIVIPSEYANKILVSDKNIEVLKECRILLIIDEDKMREPLNSH